MDETFGAALRRHRRLRGLSLRRLSAKVGYDYSYLSEIERGLKAGTADIARRCDQALQAGGELVTLMAEGCNLRADLGLRMVPEWGDAVAALVDLWQGDVERRRVLINTAYIGGVFSASALAWLTERRSMPRGDGRRDVRMADVESIREMTTAFRRLDNRWGGGQARAAVVRFLHGDVAPLLRGGRYDSTTGAALLSATAELTHLAGWMAHDVGRHGLAQRYLIQALQLTQSAGDEALGAEVLAGMSQLAVYLGHGNEGAGLARSANHAAQRAGIAALAAEAAVMEAHAEAVTGNERACSQALNLAERTLDRADRSSDPQWISYFDEAYLSAKFGHAFKALGRHHHAERFARRSLVMNNSYVRGRAFNLALLGAALAGKGEIEEAAEAAAEALTLSADLRSARANAYLDDLRAQLDPRADLPAVRRLPPHVEGS